MKITLYCIGSLKERYWKEACEEYLKRILPYAKITVEEYPDIPERGKSSAMEIEEIKNKEGEKILSRLGPNEYLIALDLNKKQLDSVAFASYLEKAFEQHDASVSFVIGGSNGLSDALKKRANDSLSFGEMTFPHQLSRVMLLEQIYRAFRIMKHQPYHK